MNKHMHTYTQFSHNHFQETRTLASCEHMPGLKMYRTEMLEQKFQPYYEAFALSFGPE